MWRKNPVESVYLATAPEGEEIHLAMALIGQDQIFSYFQVTFTPVVSRFHYRFKLVTPSRIYWYGSRGISVLPPPREGDFQYWRDQSPPQWLEKTVFYQIWPDSFARGDWEIPNWARNTTYLGRSRRFLDWNDLPGEYDDARSLDFYGGNLAGIESKIPYLVELGINGVYLNPIFTAPTNHRYDTQNYHQVDPLLGTNLDLARLTRAFHRSGIRVILDGVFNHCGIAHKWFNKCGYYGTSGAYHDETSRYGSYFTFTDHPDGYLTWLDIDTLPKFN